MVLNAVSDFTALANVENLPATALLYAKDDIDGCNIWELCVSKASAREWLVCDVDVDGFGHACSPMCCEGPNSD